MMGDDATLVGRVGGKVLRIMGSSLLLEVPVSDLEAEYKKPFGGY